MSDHPEIIEPIKKMLEERRDVADKAANDNKELFIPLDQVDEFVSKVIDVHNISVKRHNAVRAIDFLEGMSAWLWTQVGPNLADEKSSGVREARCRHCRVYRTAATGGRCQMSGTKSTKTLKAMELLKDTRLTNKQIAMRSGVSERHVRRLRNQMEVEK